MRTNWQIKIHEKNAISSPPISTCEFDDLSSLRASLAANRQRSFVIAPHLLAGRADMYERPMKTVWIYVDTGKEVGTSTIQGLCQ